MKGVVYISVIPYYIVLFIATGFFIYISPGLLDKINGIPKYQVTQTGIYLFAAILLPVLYFLVVFNKAAPAKEGDAAAEDKQAAQDKSYEKEGVYSSSKDAYAIFLPLLIAVSFHLSFILFQFLCKCKRKAEFFFVASLFTILILQLKKAEMQSNADLYSSANDSVPGIWTLGLSLLAWSMLYIILF